MSCRADWAGGAWMGPDRATSVQPDEGRSPAEPAPKASCESGRGKAGCSIHSGGVSSSLGAVRELKSGRELRKGSTLDGTVGSRLRPSLPAPGPGPPRVLHPTFPRGRQADPLGVLQGVGYFEARWGRFLGTAGVYLVRSVCPGARAAVVQVGLLTGRLTQVLSSGRGASVSTCPGCHAEVAWLSPWATRTGATRLAKLCSGQLACEVA